MKSMTGFGRATRPCGDFDISIDLSSVNKKGFELSVSLPREWAPMERLAAQRLKKTIARGKVSASFRIEKKSEAAGFSIGEEQAADAFKKLAAICEKLGFPNQQATPELLLKIDERLSAGGEYGDWEEIWKAAEPALEEAAQKLDDMRKAEGAALKADLQSRLGRLSALVGEVENSSHGTAQKYKELLLQRLENMGLSLDMNDERVLKEVCIFADKCDICEEITRLKSHIAQFSAAMDEDDAVGRKMDFICQEMGREINTTASKANSLELTKLAIELKNELERIREQTQNVE